MVNNDPEILSKEVYERELEYLKAMQEHDLAFSELIARVPQEDEVARQELQHLRSAKPNWLLDPERLIQLKERDSQLYRKVCGYYLPFLEEKAGLK